MGAWEAAMAEADGVAVTEEGAGSPEAMRRPDEAFLAVHPGVAAEPHPSHAPEVSDDIVGAFLREGADRFGGHEMHVHDGEYGELRADQGRNAELIAAAHLSSKEPELN